MPVWASDYKHLLHEGLDGGSKDEGEYKGDEDEVDGDLGLDEDEMEDDELDQDEEDCFDLTY